MFKRHFENNHVTGQFMSHPIVTCHLGLRFRLALEFGLQFSDYEALFMGNMSFSLSGGFRKV